MTKTKIRASAPPVARRSADAPGAMLPSACADDRTRDHERRHLPRNNDLRWHHRHPHWGGFQLNA
eukprot:CAMPEP_0115560574 /NCGR_PEP_ID=MMETSP0271-20121206/100543_1 /TAXON_ID=71861 /ORGANISM="Scrippsiella trochoidea, Strain CCMP3099" /LENGTH=64 /DNA_ID=CAMNT_0002994663 /DNA_START=116 /DNA_END=310 /DNA_ORIENTATION=+